MTKMSAKRHLRELQWRLMLVAAFFIVGAVLAYQFQSALIPFLLDPLHGEKLVYLNPAGGFSFIFLVSVYSGIALAFPVFMQQLYAFLRPALPEAARKKSAIIIISSFLLLFAGLAFGYFVAVPNALAFLYGFAEQYVNASLTAESYLNFIIAYTIGIGIVFQLPLLLLLIHTIKPLKPGGLMKSEKWVILLAFIAAAIITPTPDPVNQAIIAGPVIVVYQIGVIAVLLSIANARSKQRRADKKANKAPQATSPLRPAYAPAAPITLQPFAAATAVPAGDLSSYIDVAAAAEHVMQLDHLPVQPLTLQSVDASQQRSTQQPSVQKQTSQTVAPKPSLIQNRTAPQVAKQLSFKAMDGFAARPVQQPVRNVTQIKPASTQVQQKAAIKQQTAPARGFSMDGMTMPRRATSFS